MDKLALDQLMGSPLAADLSKEQAAVLADLVQTRVVEEGEYLISEGTRDDALHVLLEGKLEVVKQSPIGEPISLHILREGDLAGELSFIDGMEHSVGLRALCPCRVFSLKREDFEGLIEHEPRLVYRVMCAITRSVHRILRRMNYEHIELTNYIYKQHGRY